jgi:hypothetical protein
MGSINWTGLGKLFLLYQAAAVAASAPGCAFLFFFLVLLVNDSEYSKSTGTKPILSRGCIYLVSPGALRAPTPPRPPFSGEGSTKIKKIVCVSVGEVGVGEVAAYWVRSVNGAFIGL